MSTDTPPKRVRLCIESIPNGVARILPSGEKEPKQSMSHVEKFSQRVRILAAEEMKERAIEEGTVIETAPTNPFEVPHVELRQAISEIQKLSSYLNFLLGTRSIQAESCAPTKWESSDLQMTAKTKHLKSASMLLFTEAKKMREDINKQKQMTTKLLQLREEWPLRKIANGTLAADFSMRMVGSLYRQEPLEATILKSETFDVSLDYPKEFKARSLIFSLPGQGNADIAEDKMKTMAKNATKLSLCQSSLFAAETFKQIAYDAVNVMDVQLSEVGNGCVQTANWECKLIAIPLLENNKDTKKKKKKTNNNNNNSVGSSSSEMKDDPMEVDEEQAPLVAVENESNSLKNQSIVTPMWIRLLEPIAYMQARQKHKEAMKLKLHQFTANKQPARTPHIGGGSILRSLSVIGQHVLLVESLQLMLDQIAHHHVWGSSTFARVGCRSSNATLASTFLFIVFSPTNLNTPVCVDITVKGTRIVACVSPSVFTKSVLCDTVACASLVQLRQLLKTVAGNVIADDLCRAVTCLGCSCDSLVTLNMETLQLQFKAESNTKSLELLLEAEGDVAEYSAVVKTFDENKMLLSTKIVEATPWSAIPCPTHTQKVLHLLFSSN